MTRHIDARKLALAVIFVCLGSWHVETCDAVLTGAVANTSVSALNSTSKALNMDPVIESEVNVLFILVQTCNSKPAATRQALEQYLFSDAPARAPLTLQDLFSQCSYGSAKFSRATSAVVGPVKIPCSTGGAKEAFATNQCAAKDIAGWANFADGHVAKLLQQAQQQRTQQGQQGQGQQGQQQQAQQRLLPKYRHHVYVMPETTPCGFIGYGDVGCAAAGPCRTWIHGRFWNQVPNYFHELGHNLGLNHAHAGPTQYGDLSCSMGLCCNHRCFNAPHNWQLGWSEPLAQLEAANFPAAKWLPFKLPAQAASKDSFVLVKASSWTGGSQAAAAVAANASAAVPAVGVAGPEVVAEKMAVAATGAAAKPQRRLSEASGKPAVPAAASLAKPAPGASLSKVPATQTPATFNTATTAPAAQLPAASKTAVQVPAAKAAAAAAPAAKMVGATAPAAQAPAAGASKAPAARNLFLSYRGAVGLDAQLSPDFSNNVLVHLYGSDDRRDLRAFTGLQSKLPAYNSMWHDAASHLVLWRGSSDARWCQVVLCRYEVSMEAECSLQQVQAQFART